jgi:hypothetical protein
VKAVQKLNVRCPFIFFAQAVVEFLFEIVCYGIGKIVVTVITFGERECKATMKMFHFDGTDSLAAPTAGSFCPRKLLPYAVW